eukprot:COSAG05_NODE_3621_length_1955_cov_2.756466_2_plen_79_part_00
MKPAQDEGGGCKYRHYQDQDQVLPTVGVTTFKVQFVFSFLRHFGTGVSKFCEISICRRARALVLSVVTPWAWPLRARG